MIGSGTSRALQTERLAGLVRKRHIEGPTGVRGRNSDNRLIREKLKWSPSTVLVDGLRPTYEWIGAQVKRNGPMKGEVLHISAVKPNAWSQSVAE